MRSRIEDTFLKRWHDRATPFVFSFTEDDMLWTIAFIVCTGCCGLMGDYWRLNAQYVVANHEGWKQCITVDVMGFALFAIGAVASLIQMVT